MAMPTSSEPYFMSITNGSSSPPWELKYFSRMARATCTGKATPTATLTTTHSLDASEGSFRILL